MAKRGAWTVLLLVVAASAISVVPMVDNPETAFNEIDTPVNQSAPVAPWIKFVRPNSVPAILSKSALRTINGIRLSDESVSLAAHWPLSLLRELLCTLLV